MKLPVLAGESSEEGPKLALANVFNAPALGRVVAAAMVSTSALGVGRDRPKESKRNCCSIKSAAARQHQVVC
jgi:hypothetical protein